MCARREQAGGIVPKGETASAATTIAAALALPFVVGMPIVSTWKALLLLAGWISLACGDKRRGILRGAAILGVAVATIAVKGFLPRADIAEGHNAFLYLVRGEAIERSLPPSVFDNWRRRFDSLYPPETAPYSPRSQWRGSGVPRTAFTYSSDSIWREAKYSRQVDAIHFNSLATFRGGFSNELQYNFWQGELSRERMPFYVMYELSNASVGSRLAWIGQVFWERADGSFELIDHGSLQERAIEPGDAGRRVFALFLPDSDRIHFEMRPSARLLAAGFADGLASVAGLVVILVLSARPRWRESIRAWGIAFAAYGLVALYVSVGAGKYLGPEYMPHGGGDDGMVHDGFGRTMAKLAGEGRLVEAFMGEELVYWFTPGMRYFRMLEKLMFGDTNLGLALVVSCVPLIVFALLARLSGKRVAWLGLVLFLVLIVGNFSFVQYIANAKLGYAEAVAGASFMAGIVLLLQAFDRPSRATFPFAALAGAALLILSGFLRPNYLLAVAVVGTMLLYHSGVARKDYALAVATIVGLGLGLWMPFHNWFYGDSFYLVSKSGATVSMTLSARDYLAAGIGLIRGEWQSEALLAVMKQLKGWLWQLSYVPVPALIPVAWALQVVKILSLGLCVWVLLVRPSERRFELRLLAAGSLAAHLPMLVIFSTHYRYAMLGWDLSLIVLLLWLADTGRRWRHRERLRDPGYMGQASA